MVIIPLYSIDAMLKGKNKMHGGFRQHWQHNNEIK